MCAACEFLVSGTLRLLFDCSLYAPWAQLRRGALLLLIVVLY